MKEFNPNKIIFGRDHGVIVGDTRTIKAWVLYIDGPPIKKLTMRMRWVVPSKAKPSIWQRPDGSDHDKTHHVVDLVPGKKYFFEEQGPARGYEPHFSDMTIEREGYPAQVHKPAPSEQIWGNVSFSKLFDAAWREAGRRLWPSRTDARKSPQPTHAPGQK